MGNGYLQAASYRSLFRKKFQNYISVVLWGFGTAISVWVNINTMAHIFWGTYFKLHHRFAGSLFPFSTHQKCVRLAKCNVPWCIYPEMKAMFLNDVAGTHTHTQYTIKCLAVGQHEIDQQIWVDPSVFVCFIFCVSTISLQFQWLLQSVSVYLTAFIFNSWSHFLILCSSSFHYISMRYRKMIGEVRINSNKKHSM